MTRNLKALGLALAATLALGAVAASTATAQSEGHFFSHSENGKTHLAGQQEGENNVFTIEDEGNTVTVECPNEGSTFVGTQDESTATSVTVHPTYANEEKVCSVKFNGFSFGNAKIDTEGCNYILGADTNANEHAPVAVECDTTGEEQHEITITGPLGCTVHVPEQAPGGGAHYSDDGGSTESGEQAVTVEATVTNIQYDETGCLGIGDNGAASFESKVTVKGYEDTIDEENGKTEDGQVSITWTETE